MGERTFVLALLALLALIKAHPNVLLPQPARCRLLQPGSAAQPSPPPAALPPCTVPASTAPPHYSLLTPTSLSPCPQSLQVQPRPTPNSLSPSPHSACESSPAPHPFLSPPARSACEYECTVVVLQSCNYILIPRAALAAALPKQALQSLSKRMRVQASRVATSAAPLQQVGASSRRW